MDERISPRSPLWAYCCCYTLILASFGAHAISLDRYPLPYVDESFFYYPAIRAMEGQGLNYRIHADAPYGDTIWAYHAPFFPRTQVVAFRLMGVSEFACRITPLLAGHLAILILCQLLLRIGLWRTAITLVVAWLGDRFHYSLLNGRMEGICLLCETAGFIYLLKAVTTARTKGILTASFFAGVLLGVAVGFHPGTASFAVCALFMLPLLVEKQRGQAVACLVAGGLVAAALILICWLPSPRAALEQFVWTRIWGQQHRRSMTFAGTWLTMIQGLGWSKYWLIGLWLAMVSLIMPLVRGVRNHNVTPSGDILASKVFLLASAFSVCSFLGIIFMAGKAIAAYYWVHFTIWPVVAIAVTLETTRSTGTVRQALLGVCTLLFVTWIPSLGHNVLRVRDAVQNYDALDRDRFARRLNELIPEGASVTGCPQFVLVARKAGIRFVPFPWYPESSAVPTDDYILLSEDTVLNEYPRVESENLGARHLILEGSMAPGTKLRYSRFWLYGPIESR